MTSLPTVINPFPSQWQSAAGRLRLHRILHRLNAGRTQAGCRTRLEERLQLPAYKLAVYGTLRPGGSNHHLIAEFPGEWTRASVRGRLLAQAPAARLGYPAMVWQPEGDEIEVDLLSSPALKNFWHVLDEFEGEHYRRILVPIERDNQIIAVANLYEAVPGREEALQKGRFAVDKSQALRRFDYLNSATTRFYHQLSVSRSRSLLLVQRFTAAIILIAMLSIEARPLLPVPLHRGCNMGCSGMNCCCASDPSRQSCGSQDTASDGKVKISRCNSQDQSLRQPLVDRFPPVVSPNHRLFYHLAPRQPISWVRLASSFPETPHPPPRPRTGSMSCNRML